jgi:DNA-3-methyladenine glycosylase II
LAELVDADPALDPDRVLDGWPTDLWAALVFNVVGQQLSVAATRAIVARLEALHGGRLPTPAELLATDPAILRRVGLSRAKTAYLRDLAERLADGRLEPERLRKLDDDSARSELMQVKGVGRFTADGVLMLALRRPDVWPAADLALRRAVERVWALETPASLSEIDAIGDRFRPWRTLAARLDAGGHLRPIPDSTYALPNGSRRARRGRGRCTPLPRRLYPLGRAGRRRHSHRLHRGRRHPHPADRSSRPARSDPLRHRRHLTHNLKDGEAGHQRPPRRSIAGSTWIGFPKPRRTTAGTTACACLS